MATDPTLTGLQAMSADPLSSSSPSSDRIQGAPVRHRRSGRIARRVEVQLHWQEQGDKWLEAPAETKMISRYGCLLAGQCRIKLGEEIRVVWPEKQRETKAKVVFRQLGGSSEPVQLAVEFVGSDDFWEIDFPPPFMSIMA